MSWFVLVEGGAEGRMFCTRARELGLTPIVLTREPGHAADGVEALRADTGDPAVVLAACRRLGGRVAAITSGSERHLATAAEVAGRLGLPHPDPAAIRACRDKAVQRALLREAGVPGAAFATARTPGIAVAAAQAIGFPVVVKPVAGSASVASRLCRDAAEAEAAAHDALRAGSTVMVEEYLRGAEYSVETFGDQVVGVTRKHLGAEPYFVEIGHDFPAPLDLAARAEAGELAHAALKSLELCWGPARIEIRYGAAGPRVVEVSPRPAGGVVARMVEAATGIDLVRHTVAKAAGLELPLRATVRRAASVRFLVAAREGRLAGIDGLEAARAVPGVVEAGLTREPGQEVRPRGSPRDRIGYVIAVAGTGVAAARAATAGLATLTARITR
ncbi:ATP-grasp domain-containing protein [Nonomuraea typhae]|uniref:ATP-grasp domain-containing protein n=1 Tax=Nonomuraea typhae TaxID=2603600 RepID=UPI0012F95B73|nr:ATP-grasp domain-containing protein [Nonomuraea typhae]